MGDYFLDFRRRDDRRLIADTGLRFFPDMEIDRVETDYFDLTVTRVGAAELWAPYTANDGTTIALAGRVAFSSSEWRRAELRNGVGGLACKAIYNRLLAHGISGVQGLSGAYAVHIFEPTKKKHTLILDAAGCYPSFRPRDLREGAFSSHPDVLARALGVSGSWDYVSLATFVAIGQVPHPHTYYRDIIGLEHCAGYTFDLSEDAFDGQVERIGNEPPRFNSMDAVDEDQLADELANAIAVASQQATHERLGRTFIAMSGGLDSRMLASQSCRHANVRAFCMRGSSVNSEFRTASSIAHALGITLVPMIRTTDHYANSAPLGVRISGGMGSIASNHFLGFREILSEIGCENLVTGCYFDYLFKSLALDTRESRLSRREKLSSFQMSSYLPFLTPNDKYESLVYSRLERIAPKRLRGLTTDEKRLELMARRTFPLWREGDNIQRLIALRVFDWYAPAAFRDILDVYFRTPINSRLNRSLFKKVVLRSVPSGVKNIPDNNTELPIDAPQILQSFSRYRIAGKRRLVRLSGTVDTSASWINWHGYLRQSDEIRRLWRLSNKDSRELVEEITGAPYSEAIEGYLKPVPDYFLRLLTIALWASQDSIE